MATNERRKDKTGEMQDQTTWFRELRLVFGASTAASAAVLAIFMGGLGLGGWLLGMYADRHGRRNALALSVLLMSGGSLAIGLTPSFGTIAGEATQANTRFTWRATVSGTPNPAFRKIEIVVADPGTPAFLFNGTVYYRSAMTLEALREKRA